jgi:mRNA-degrading endonuclease RelE of RelBE toxin-antitoxin system
MKYKVLSIPPFDKQLKRLAKKYPSLRREMAELFEALENKPENKGESIGNKCYKIRLSIASKGKGKSGGARVIAHIHFVQSKVYLLSIYDKSEINNISDHEINNLLSYI